MFSLSLLQAATSRTNPAMKKNFFIMIKNFNLLIKKITVTPLATVNN
jgi:hypothetical protein